MIDILEHKRKLFIERFIIGVEEPILIKPVGEFVAKIDSGNSGYNVIHGENIQRQGSMLFFTTYDKNGMVKHISKPVHEEVTINMGGGHVETRPVILMDVKFADTDYKKIPFSVSDRTQQTNKVLICKDFVCNQLDALIDPAAKEISNKNLQAEVVKEGVLSSVKGGMDRFNQYGRQFIEGEGGALTSYLAGSGGGGGKAKNVKSKEKEYPKEKGTRSYDDSIKQEQQKQEEEPQNTEEQKHEHEQQVGIEETGLNTSEYQQFLDMIKSRDAVEKQDAERSRITAERRDILQSLGFERSNVHKDTAYWPILNYLGYALGNISNTRQQALRKSLQKTLKKEQQINSSVEVNDEDLKCLFEANEEVFDDGSTPTKDAAQEIPQQEEPKNTDVVKSFFDRNYFSFGFLQMASKGQLYNEMRVFRKIQITRAKYFVGLGERFFNNIKNRTFMPNSQYAIDFVKGVVKELQKHGISGAICVNIGAPPNRITRFYTGEGMTIKATNTDQVKIERTLTDLYNTAKHKWINDTVLKNYKLSIDLDREYYEDLKENGGIKNVEEQLPINAMLRIFDIVEYRTDVEGNELSKDDPKLNYVKKVTDAAFDKAKRQMVPYTPPASKYKVEQVKERWNIGWSHLRWLNKNGASDIARFDKALKNNDGEEAIRALESLKNLVGRKMNYKQNPKQEIISALDETIKFLEENGRNAFKLKDLRKAKIFDKD